MTRQPELWNDEVAARFVLDTTPWLSCDECFRLVDGHVEQLLRDPEVRAPALQAHLRGCPACAEEAETLLELAASDAGLDPTAALARLAR